MKIFAEIIKRDDAKRMVYGYASTEALDAQEERVSKGAIEEALPDYMRFGNVREMHQMSAVGVTKSAEIDEKGLYIQAKIVDDDAWNKVVEGVYKGFSIGGKSLTKVDGTITKMKLTEISVVDRPANPEAVIDAWKADAETPFYKAMTAAIEKEAVGELASMVNAGAVSPTVLLELAKRKFSEKERQDAADAGEALPDGSFPIKNVSDLKNAIKAFGRAKDKKAAKAHIIERAKKLGATDELPDDWKPSGKEEKADAATSLRKGLYQVGWFSNLLDSIACLQRENEFEQGVEGDEDSECPEALKAWLGEGLKILSSMVSEESAELMGVKDVEVIEAAASAGDLTKAGAKFSAATKAKLAEAHGHIKKAAEHMTKAKGAPMGEASAHLDKCEKCIGKADSAMNETGYEDEAETPRQPPKKDDETDKVLLPGDLLKAATDSAVAVLQSELAKRDTTIADLTTRLKAIEDQPLPAKGVQKVVVVDKTQDNGSEPITKSGVQPVLNDDGSVNVAATQVKQIHSDGPMVSAYYRPSRQR
jgi:HK97 family phage prohead protease